METLFSVVDLLCSQNPRNCRQNEKGSHGLSIKIKAVASTRKEYSFWIGGSILVSLSTRFFDPMSFIETAPRLEILMFVSYLKRCVVIVVL